MKHEVSNANFFRIVRKRSGLSPWKFSIRSEISPSSLHRLENEGKGCRLKTLRQLRSAAGLSWEEFGALIDEHAGDE